jgi:hypothetical protein
VREALGTERTQRLCLSECYHPSDRRHRITRIEVVRVRPQSRSDEPIGDLIQDPWRTFPCPPDPAGCSVTFDDPDFVEGGRDSVYYVRAIEEPRPSINAAGLSCTGDGEGDCVEVDPCGGLKPFEDDCLADAEERAWSSPIFVDWSAVPQAP